MSAFDSLPIVKSGIWLYAGSVPVPVKITESPEMLGTGDCEDPPETAENQAVTCYFLHYEMAGAPGNFCNMVPNLPTLDAAIAHAAHLFPGITWKSPLQ